MEGAKDKPKDEKPHEGQKEERFHESTVLGIRDISVALDTYDDIFSDFDPRPYAARGISIDFLKELERRILTDVRGNFEIRFFLPSAMRNEKTESHVVRRLQAYFRMKAKELELADEKRRKNGILFILAGIAPLFAYAFLAQLLVLTTLTPFLEVLLVPFGWFAVWVGLEKFVQEREQIANELTFYQKLSKADYIFLSEEDEVPIARPAGSAPSGEKQTSG